MTVSFNDFGRISNTRITKMLTRANKENVSHNEKLGKFAEYFKGAWGTDNQQKLEKLWDFLNENANHFDSSNIVKFATFVEIRSLADIQDQPKFNVLRINQTLYQFRINETEILEADLLTTDVESEIINSFLDGYGQFQGTNITKHTIFEKAVNIYYTRYRDFDRSDNWSLFAKIAELSLEELKTT